MVLSIFLSIISIFNNLYVIIFQREIVKILFLYLYIHQFTEVLFLINESQKE